MSYFANEGSFHAYGSRSRSFPVFPSQMGYGYASYEVYEEDYQEDRGFDVRCAAPRHSTYTHHGNQPYAPYEPPTYGVHHSHSSRSRYGGGSNSVREEQPRRRARAYAYEDPITGAYEEEFVFESQTSRDYGALSTEPILEEDEEDERSERTKGADEYYYGDYDEGADYFSHHQEQSHQRQRRRHDEPMYERPYNVRNAAPRDQGNYDAAHKNPPRARQRKPEYTEEVFEGDNCYHRSRRRANEDDYPEQGHAYDRYARAAPAGTYSNGRSYSDGQPFESQGQRSQGQRSQRQRPRDPPPPPLTSGPLPPRSKTKPQAMEVDTAIKYIVSLDDMAWYDILGVKTSVTEAELKKAYLLLSKKIHPDKCKHANATKAFQKVSAANEGLKKVLDEDQ